MDKDFKELLKRYNISLEHEYLNNIKETLNNCDFIIPLTHKDGSYRNLHEVLGDLSQIWNTLNAKEQKELSKEFLND